MKGMTDAQIQAATALKEALQHCHNEGLLVIVSRKTITMADYKEIEAAGYFHVEVYADAEAQAIAKVDNFCFSLEGIAVDLYNEQAWDQDL